MFHLPKNQLTGDDVSKLQSLESELRGAVIGQDHAIAAVVQAIKLSRAGLANTEKPVGSFLFAGPTGVGKTELSKRLASALGIELIRFDMSEYAEEYAVSKLIGSSPGLVTVISITVPSVMPAENTAFKNAANFGWFSTNLFLAFIIFISEAGFIIISYSLSSVVSFCLPV